MEQKFMEMSKDQATFFDRIYPTISQRLYDLEREQKCKHEQLNDLRSQIQLMNLTVEQYKKKIQKIEQSLIDRGLKSILKGMF
jgi:wobble nucleotide-excising tRNase